VGKPTLELDAIRHRRKRENAGTGREEVSGLIIGVEAEQIRIEHTEKNFSTNGQDPESKMSDKENKKAETRASVGGVAPPRAPTR